MAVSNLAKLHRRAGFRLQEMLSLVESSRTFASVCIALPYQRLPSLLQ